MLAKVVKKDAAVAVSAFNIPDLGSAPSGHQLLSEIVLPAVSVYDEFASFHDDVVVGSAADDIIQAARNEAGRIIGQAKEESELIIQRANDAVSQSISGSIDEQIASRVSDLRGELATSIKQIGSLGEELRNEVESQTVDLALRIAKKIVGREVMTDRDIALTLVRVSLDKLHNRSAAKVHLNPEDHAYVLSHLGDIQFRGSIELIEDASVALGGCLITTDTGDIDARIDSQFDEIAHGLLN